MSRGTKKQLTHVGSTDWNQAVPSHLAEPLRIALEAWERNDLSIALKKFGECWDLIPPGQEVVEGKPILVFGAQAASAGYFALRAREPNDPKLAEWYSVAENILAGACEIAPQDSVAAHQMGRFYHDALDFAKAVPWYRRALLLNPHQTETWGNLGTVFYETGNRELANEAWDRCLSEGDRIPSSRMSKSYIYLRRGQYAEGWAEYNWRWHDSQFDRDYGRTFDLGPHHWNGSALPKSHRLLVIGEQGHGDHVQFGRYVSELRRRGMNVVGVETRAILKTWFQATYPDIEVIERDSGSLPGYTHWVSMLDLPGFLGTTVETIPPVVSPMVELVPRLSADLCVGIAWEGAKGNPSDKLRSIPAEDLRHLAGIPGVQFVNLQFDRNAPMLAESWLGAIDGTTGCVSVFDTAKVIAALDVVLAVDTLTCHLAGTLGVKTWLLQRFCADWRWMDDRSDCPWYPSMQTFRQKTPGDWPEVLARVRAQLEQEAACRASK